MYRSEPLGTIANQPSRRHGEMYSYWNATVIRVIVVMNM
jgi:hypothetical protein